MRLFKLFAAAALAAVALDCSPAAAAYASLHVWRSVDMRKEAENYQANWRKDQVQAFKDGTVSVEAYVAFRDRKGTFYKSLRLVGNLGCHPGRAKREPGAMYHWLRGQSQALGYIGPGSCSPGSRPGSLPG